MELKVNFKEQEIRALYYESFDQEEEWVDRLLKDRKRDALILGGVSAFFFILTYFHSDWIYYALFFSFITVLYMGWTWVIREQRESKIYDQKMEVDRFLVKYRTVKDIHYTYDEERIQYYESGELSMEIEWASMIGVVKNEKWIYVRFKNSDHNIWIARVTAEDQDMRLFEQVIEDWLRKKNEQLAVPN